MKKIEKYLNNHKWYHGTSLQGWKEICEKKIQANHNIYNELDFGYGFYLTPKKSQAENFTNNVIKYRKENSLQDLGLIFPADNSSGEDEIAVVIEFEFEPIEYFENQSYNFGVFSKYDDEFANFVFHNRTDNVNGEAHHNYDLIFGVMSDTNPPVVINRFKNDQIGKNEVIEELKKSTSSKQLSIHNQKICDIIKPSRAYLVENREELDVSDYFVREGHKFSK